MEYREFVREAILNLDSEVFESVKHILVEEYLRFSVLDSNDITAKVLAEKACDYFEKVELDSGKSFDKIISSYMNDLDSVVEPRVERIPQQKKKDSTPVYIPRARKYYDKAVALKKKPNLTYRLLVDYTRIMLCLYMAEIKSGFNTISDFDFASTCLEPIKILRALREEKAPRQLPGGKKKRFTTEDVYGSSNCMLILVVIILHVIMNENVLGGNYYG